MTLLYSIKRHQPLQRELVNSFSFEDGGTAEEQYPNGEPSLLLDLVERRRDRDVVLLGSTDPSEIMTTVAFATTLSEQAQTFSLVIPYFRTSTQERSKIRDEREMVEVPLTRVAVALFNTIPPALRCKNRVFMFDLHTDEIVTWFDRNISMARQHSLNPALINYIQERGIELSDVTSPDLGRRHVAGKVARFMGAKDSGVEKVRLSATEIQSNGGQLKLRGKVVAIWDDMGRTFGTMIGAGRKVREAGADQIWAVCAHADFAKGAVDRLRESNLFQGLIVTDTWSEAAPYKDGSDPFVHVVPCAPTIAQVLSDSGL